MAKMMVFIGGTYRRPNSKYSFTFEPGPVPQDWPEDVVAYAVDRGKAERVPAKNRGKATVRKGNTGE
jgi:hypothetical protein